MKGGLEGTEEELLYVDDKMYPRRKIETIQRLMEELDENDLKEWLIRDILKPRGKRGAKKVRPVHQPTPLIHQDVLEQFDNMISDLEPVNKIIEDFKSPAQKEFAVSEAIKVAKKRGRPKIYHTEEERRKARNEKNLEYKKRKREEKAHKKDEKSEQGESEDEDEFPLNQIIEPVKLTPAQVVANKIAKSNPKDPVEKYMLLHGVPREQAEEEMLKFGLTEQVKKSRKSRKTKGSGIRKIVKSKLGEVVRGDIVARIMKKMGLSLGEASRYVKLHNLY